MKPGPGLHMNIHDSLSITAIPKGVVLNSREAEALIFSTLVIEKNAPQSSEESRRLGGSKALLEVCVAWWRRRLDLAANTLLHPGSLQR